MLSPYYFPACPRLHNLYIPLQLNRMSKKTFLALTLHGQLIDLLPNPRGLYSHVLHLHPTPSHA